MSSNPVHLSREGVSLVLAPSPSGVPLILHWGRALGELDHERSDLLTVLAPGVPHSALDRPRRRGLLGESVSGFTGMPALEGFRPARTSGSWAPRLRDWTWRTSDDADGRVTLVSTDEEAGWRVGVEIELSREGLVRMQTSVTNSAPDRLHLQAVRTALPVGPHATELLDLTGRWCRERTPQRRPWLAGTHARESRHGRPGHDATLVLAAGTPGFANRHGEVWATHVAWSGDHVAYAERTAEGECLLGGYELLGPGEISLDEQDTYTGPWLVGSWSDAGLDGVSDRLHDWTRRQSTRGARPRPVVVNTWEAAYFDHDLESMTRLADAAATVGAERFVLDDGWFAGRRDDRAGLGDLTVDQLVWPKGLHPLIDHVKGLGLDFGLWVEPEMVNVDSDLAREHPDWILRGRAELPAEWRHQQVLDLQVPAAYAHVRDALSALLDEYDIAYLKWDHNRDLVDVAHAGRPAVHGQTVAFYRLLDELRTAWPDLEIETCASGGARIDLEVLTRTDRVWPSDTVDPVERQRIQRWTSVLVPPEMLGAHIGAAESVTTGRTHRLGFRAATALIGHLGLELDLTVLGSDQLAEVSAWVELHQRMRDVVASGRLVHGDHPDPALAVTGVVAADAREAFFVVATVDSTLTQAPTPVLLPGLDPSTSYRLQEVSPSRGGPLTDLGETWVDGTGVVVEGSVLTEVGVQLPATAPESAYVLHVEAVGMRDV